MKESGIQRAILDFMESIGLLAWNHYQGPIVIGRRKMVPNPHPGLPDIFGILPDGKFLMIEVKIPEYLKTHAHGKKKIRLEQQREWIRKCNDNGGVGFIATSVMDVCKKLTELGYIEIPGLEKQWGDTKT